MKKKSYLGFVLWLIGFCAAYFACIFLPDMGTQVLVAILDNIMNIGVFVLALIVYLTENVYWYNGTDYKAAERAGSERRKAFAFEHMKRFGILALAFAVYSVVSILIGIPYGIDIVVAIVGLIATAISTINIKL